MTTTAPNLKSEPILGRPLPSSAESECVILGAILLDNGLIAAAAEHLVPDDFYSPLNRRIFAAMIALFGQGKSIDAVLIGEELKKEGSLESIGGASAITKLIFGVPHLFNIQEYIDVVADKKRIRELIRTCSAITSEALAEEDSADEILGSAESQIFGICNKPSKSSPERLNVLAHRSLAMTFDRQEKGLKVDGIQSGIRRLDDLTGGWQKSDLIIIAARPSMGKTAGMTQFAVDGLGEGRVGLVFSLEMSKEQIIARMICSEAKVNLQAYRQARLNNGEKGRVQAAYERFQDKLLYIDDTPAITPMQVMAKARRTYAEHKRLDLIAIDYLGLMNPSRRSDGNRVQEVSQISRELKHVAKELNVPVIALSQLSRAPEARNPARPILSDLRDSGSIEQDADVVIFVYRDEYYRPAEENRGLAELIVAKQRNGPTMPIEVTWLPHCTRFENR